MMISDALGVSVVVNVVRRWVLSACYLHESFLFRLVPVVGFGYIGVPGVMVAGVKKGG